MNWYEKIKLAAKNIPQELYTSEARKWAREMLPYSLQKIRAMILGGTKTHSDGLILLIGHLQPLGLRQYTIATLSQDSLRKLSEYLAQLRQESPPEKNPVIDKLRTHLENMFKAGIILLIEKQQEAGGSALAGDPLAGSNTSDQTGNPQSDSSMSAPPQPSPYSSPGSFSLSGQPKPEPKKNQNPYSFWAEQQQEKIRRDRDRAAGKDRWVDPNQYRSSTFGY